MALAPGAWRRSVPRCTPWRLIATGCLLFVVGDVLWQASEAFTGEMPVVSVADVLYGLGYLPLGAGLVLLLRDGRRGRDLDAVIDGAIVGFASLTATWLLFIEPRFVESGDTLARAVNTVYPLADILVLTLVLRLLFDRDRRSVGAVILALGIGTMFVGDLAFVMAVAAPPMTFNRWFTWTWVVGYVLTAVAALVGDRQAARADPPERASAAEQVPTGSGWWRVLALGLALAVPAVIPLARGFTPGGSTLVLLGLAELVLVLLVTLRLGLLVGVVRRQLRDARELHESLAHQAAHDPVTGLPNRERFTAELARALSRRRSRGAVAVLFVDLDQFKAVNDTLGHDAGDRLLQAVAGRIASVLRSGDLLARFGGDEFLVLLEDTDSEGEALAVARRVAAAVRTPVPLRLPSSGIADERNGTWEGTEHLVVTATVGVVVTTEPGVTAQDVLRDADAALLEGKQRGRDVVIPFAASMRDHLARWLAMEHELRHAVDSGQLRLRYQPEIDLATSSMFGVEALLRWDHPERGLLSPGVFLSVAESSGLIAPIGRWVIEEACRQARAWRDRYGEEAPVISVNISPTHLAREDVTGLVESNLRRHRLPASALRVEVTETALLSDHPHVSAQVAKLHDLGVEVAVDDFGTGFFSLSHLKGLAADLIKIDRSFVSGVGSDRTDDAIIHSVIDLARRLGVRTIAEGVETAEQSSLLVAAGCDVVQGYHFARPMTAPALEELIEAGGFSLACDRQLRLAE